jgi:DNA-binding NtrC family response regulator
MVEIELPQLAERREDLLLLERFLIERFAEEYGRAVKGITPRAQIVLARYPWPGNIRELKSVLGSVCLMAEGETIDVRDLPERIRARAVEERPTGTHADWARDVAKAENVPLLDLYNRIAVRYDPMGETAVTELFAEKRVHRSRAGAELNASVVVAALQALTKDPAVPYLRQRPAAIW